MRRAGFPVIELRAVDATGRSAYTDSVAILLTGFGPWARNRRNPSGEVARRLGGHVLSVNYERAGREIRSLIARERPGAVLMLGLAERRQRISLETMALNIDHSEDGRHRRWRKRINRGPLVRRSRLPIDRLHRMLSRARIPVRVSHHAGTFVCNHVFYLALGATRVPCGFIHVPPARAVPLRTQVRAVRLILGELDN